MSKNPEFVKFDKVDKSYDGKVLVVKDLQLDIAEGEFITMLGPSGSGKTTCLMMLAGFETPTHGEILLDGNIISNIPPHKRGIGMVFQNYALFPHMTVYENLAFPLKCRDFSNDKIDDIYNEAIAAGASGGKVIGSGGGGFLLMYCDQKFHKSLKKRLYKLPIINFNFVEKGSEIIFKS